MTLARDEGNQELVDLCTEAGGLTFARFMYEALWGAHGYYARHARIGGAGADFVTSASSPLFGATLAQYVAAKWQEGGASADLWLVELGPGEGTLAAHLLDALFTLLPPHVRVHLTLVEQSVELATRQQQRLTAWARMAPAASHQRLTLQWLTRMQWVGPDVAVIANEVLDALPVERLRRVDGGFEQGFVRYTPAAGYTLEWRPAAAALAARAARWLPLPLGTQAELCLELAEFFADLAGVGDTVHALFIDYGITSSEWADGVRPTGTVRAYAAHRLVDVLDNPGFCDITADVYWDYTGWVAAQHGFSAQPVRTQSSFLLQWGIADWLGRLQEREAGRAGGSTPDLGPEWNRYRVNQQFKQLVLPGGMGERFGVLECARGQRILAR